MARSYRDFIGWQKAMQLSVKLYRLTHGFPREELFGTTSQLRRAGVSILSNIAEGHGRGTRPQLLQFMRNARGSAFEIEAQLIFCHEAGLGQIEPLQECQALCDEVCRILTASINSLSAESDS